MYWQSEEHRNLNNNSFALVGRSKIDEPRDGIKPSPCHGTEGKRRSQRWLEAEPGTFNTRAMTSVRDHNK